jgi:uncharacterized protein (TIGR00730 family)
MMNKKYPKQPLTIKKINEQLENRLDRIEDEFRAGFEFVKTYQNSVTFWGSARVVEGDDDYDKARELSSKIVKELDYAIVTGGGPGIMEAANRGACEAGGKSVGYTIKLPMEQVTNEYLTDHLDFYYFFARKVCLSFAAEAYIFFPGGFGTYDELFEILTLVQTKKIEDVPVILFGSKYWNKYLKYIKKNLLKHKKIDDFDLNLFTITDDMDKVVKIVKDAPQRLL